MGQLPNNQGYSADTDEYLDAWDEFVQPLADFLSIEPSSFDPTVSYIYVSSTGTKFVQLPQWFVALFNEKMENKHE